MPTTTPTTTIMTSLLEPITPAIPTPHDFLAEKIFREKKTFEPTKEFRKYGNQGKKSMKVRTQLWACDRNQKKGKEIVIGKKVHQKREKKIGQNHHAATLRSQVKMKN
jgi:hypothetical protein